MKLIKKYATVKIASILWKITNYSVTFEVNCTKSTNEYSKLNKSIIHFIRNFNRAQNKHS